MKSVSRLLAVLLAVALVGVAMTGCSSNNVATVNGQAIPVADLQAQFDAVKAQYPQMVQGAGSATQVAQLKKQLLDSMIDQILVAQAAKEMGVSVSDADVQKQFDQIRKQFPTDAAYQAALTKFKTTEAKLKEQIRQQLLTQAVTAKLGAQTQVTDAQIKAYYDKNKAMFQDSAGKRVAHILVANKAKADALLKQVQSGGNFAALAKANSTDKASASNGGDLGWPATPFVPEFQAAINKLTKIGQLSPVVKTTYGYHIIKLEEQRSARTKTLAEVKDQIKQILTQQAQAAAYQKFLAGLRAKYKDQIKIDDAALAAIVVSSTPTK
jgi:foldase protein PrsA